MGGTLGVLGGVGMLTHVCLTSTSLGAFLAGSGTWAAVSIPATLGLATGGIGLLVGCAGLGAWALVANLMSEGDDTSRDLAKWIIDSLDGVVKATDAAVAHLQKLE